MTASSSPPTPILERLKYWADTRGNELAVAFPTRSAATVELTWSDVYQQLENASAHLHARGVTPGDVVLILTASPREQILSFLGALRCGALPSVLSYPSIKQSEARFLDTFRPIAASCGARFLLGSREFEPVVGDAAKQIGFVPITSLATPAPGAPPPMPRPERLFLQYSSGTTGLRKAVIITQKLFDTYVSSWLGCLEFTKADRIASWLPLYHDMGLVGTFLITMWSGAFAFHLSPFEWLKDPISILQQISKYKATFCWMPNFAYKFLCARVTDAEMEGVRLDSMRAFINGGEVIRADSVRAFYHRFKAFGLKKNAMQTSWGLAEALMGVTQTSFDRPARIDRVDAEELLSNRRAVPADSYTNKVLEPVTSGRAGPGAQVRIAGATEDRVVGEIEILTNSMADGYNGASKWPEESVTPDGWFRTGDLGYLADGDLFVTGRKKDLIIHCGVNLHPADLEEIVDDVPGVKPGRCVAFGLPDEETGTERVVVMAETVEDGDIDDATVIRAIREAIRAKMGVPVADVALSKLGSLVKSTSGKLSRAANRDAYLARTVAAPVVSDAVGEIVAGPVDGDAHVKAIIDIWKSVLKNVPKIGRDDDFVQLGGDSLANADVASRVRRTWGVDLSLQTLFEARTPARQAAAVAAARASGATARSAPAPTKFVQTSLGVTGAVGSLAATFDEMSRIGAQLVFEKGAPPAVRAIEGRLPAALSSELGAQAAALASAFESVGDGRYLALAPFQARLLKAYANPNFNISGAMRIHGAIDPARLDAAFRAVAERNDALRMVFPMVAGRVFSRVVRDPSIRFDVVDFTKLSAEDAERSIAERGARTRDDGVFEFSGGPLLHVELFQLAPNDHVLLLVANHATQDGLSFPYMFDDVSAAYRGNAIPERPQYSDALAIEQTVYTAPITEERTKAWKARFTGFPEAFTLARKDAARASTGPRHGELVERDIGVDLVEALTKIASVETVSLATLLLGAFESSIVKTTGQVEVLHGVTALNRNPTTEGAIGSFGKGNPCHFRLGGKSFREILRHVNERVHWLLDNDSPQLTRFLQENQVPGTLVNFNYISIPSKRLALDLPDVRCAGMEWFRRGSKTHPMLRDMALFAVHRPEGGIRLNCAYDTAIHDKATVDRFVETFMSTLHDLAKDASGTLAAKP